MSSPDTTTSGDSGASSSSSSSSTSSAQQQASEPVVAPDDIGPATVHVPGQPPGARILDGPAEMRIGGPAKTSSKRKR